MRFLVTGGAGFLGAALANRLAADGHHVQALDDLSHGDAARLSGRVALARGDVDNVPLLWSLLQDVDCVYHLAARVSVPQSILYPREYARVNVGGTVSLMEAMRDTGVGRVVLASSGAVYGRQPRQPVREDDPPHPDSPYAVSKWAAEQYIHTIGELWGLETVALRIFNAYGPGQNLPTSHAPVVPRFLQAALSGGSLVIYGDGRQTRDYVYVDDVVAALVAAATAKGINRAVINVGSGRETSVAELITAIEQATGREVNVLNNPQKAGGVARLAADIGRARELLGFQPAVALAAGLRLTLQQDTRFSAR
ncbi:MAG: NAD-dependent epimerase/dehydratase family protein [Candidatus Promineofilum sp.]|nr:NAD-dependent epimerase/dehydratase family protein [Promineifilum sp.]